MESNGESSTADALAMANKARQSAADRLITPWWYHPVLGLAVACYTVVLSSLNPIVIVIGMPLLLSGVAALVYAYRRTTGVWIWGFSAGHASRWAYALSAITLICMGGAITIRGTTSLIWPIWCLAGIVLIGVIVIGRKFDTELRSQLQGSP